MQEKGGEKKVQGEEKRARSCEEKKREENRGEEKRDYLRKAP